MARAKRAVENSDKNTAAKAAKAKPRTRGAVKRDPTTGRVSGGNPGNSGGKKGRSGRPPNEFKDFCAELAGDPDFREALRLAATSPMLRGYGAAVKLVLSYGVGLPVERHEHTGKDGGPIETRELSPAERQARVLALLEAAKARRAGQGA